MPAVQTTTVLTGGAAAEVRSSVTFNITAATTFLVGKPAGLADDDTVVVFAAIDSNVETMAAPDGTWTLIDGPVDSTTSGDVRGYLWRHIATAEDVAGSGWTFTKSGSARAGAGIAVAVIGVDTTDPVPIHSTLGTATTGTPTAGPITTDEVDQLVLTFAGLDASATGGGYSWPVSMTLLHSYENPTPFVVVGCAQEVIATPTSVSRQATQTGGLANEEHVTSAIAFRNGVTSEADMTMWPAPAGMFAPQLLEKAWF